MTRDRINEWVRDEIRTLSAYHVPDAKGLLKLDAMENPYSLPEPMIDDWLEVLRDADINRYPDPDARALKQKLRHYLQIPSTSDLILGNGSDELIQLIAMMLAGPGRVMLAPEPSFAMFPLIAKATGMQYVGVDLKRDDFSLDLESMLAAIKKHQPALVFIANPNNPTANLFAEKTLKAILDAAPGLVVLDEAYYHFTGGVTAFGWLSQYDNLLVMRTLSKVGLAGLRLGILAGSPLWLAELNKLRLPYNINILTQLSAGFLLDHAQVLDGQAQQLCHDRSHLEKELKRLPGVKVWSSQTNFLLIRVNDAELVFSELKSHGILIKKLHGAHPLLDQCLRITVSTPEENSELLRVLRLIL